MKQADNYILCFDGACNLCNGFVQWVIKRDRLNRISFATLKSPFANELARTHHLDPTDNESIPYLSRGKLYVKSAAVIALANDLGGIYRLALIGRLLPSSWRDMLYDLVARNRYRLAGTQASCLLPTPDLQKRFIT